jgi:hypothetical protein
MLKSGGGGGIMGYSSPHSKNWGDTSPPPSPPGLTPMGDAKFAQGILYVQCWVQLIVDTCDFFTEPALKFTGKKTDWSKLHLTLI